MAASTLLANVCIVSMIMLIAIAGLHVVASTASSVRTTHPVMSSVTQGPRAPTSRVTQPRRMQTTDTLRLSQADQVATPHTPLISISTDGLGPSTIGLSWTQTSSACFSSYTVQYSTAGSNGPWTTWYSTTDNSQISVYGYGMTPGSTMWYQEVDANCIGGSSTTNQLQVTQPNAASLTYTTPTPSTAQFTWNNNAQYTGLVGFVSYQLMESINGGSYTAATTITAETTTTYTVNGLTAGTGYSFYVNTTDDCTSCSPNGPSSSNSNVVTFGTPQPLVASASAKPTSVDVGTLVSLTCVATGGTSPYTFAWNFGDGTQGAGQTVSHSYSSPGTLTAVCTVTDNSGTSANSPVGITVDPTPSIVATVNHAQASPGTSLTFTATPSGGSGSFVSYQWTFGDGDSSAGSSVIHAYSRAGSYIASVTVTDSNGGIAIGNVSLSVSNLSVTAGVSPQTGVPGDTFTFSASATGGGGAPFTFSWQFGDGGTGSGAQTTHAYANAGNFTATVTATDSLGGANTTRLAIVTVYNPITAFIQVSTQSPTAGEGVTLTGTATGGSGGYTCSWNFGDSNSATGCTPAHSWSTSGTYTVTLSVTDSQGHTASTTMTVNVQSAPESTFGGAGGLLFYGIIAAIIVAVVVVVLALLFLRRKKKDQAAPSPPTMSNPSTWNTGDQNIPPPPP